VLKPKGKSVQKALGVDVRFESDADPHQGRTLYLLWAKKRHATDGGFSSIPNCGIGFKSTWGRTVSIDQLAVDISSASRLKGTFTLRSGQQSDEYFDKYRFESDPALLRRVAQRMLPLIPDDAEVLVGLELGGVPIATAISLESSLPVLFARKKAKEYGTCNALEGGDIRGRRAVLIEDVITTGGAVAEAAAHVRAAEGEVIAVVCAIWRGEGVPHIAGAPDLRVFAAFTKADLLTAKGSP
jgi:orotate phosphoribosyltransferase